MENTSLSTNTIEAEGRKKVNWKGVYQDVDSKATFLSDKVRYLLVKIKEKSKADPSILEEVLIFLPISWLSKDDPPKNYLYPPADSLKKGTDGNLIWPPDWANRLFARHYYPKSSWEEYDLAEIVVAKPKSQKSVLHAYKSINMGKLAEDITDSDVPMSKFRSKRRYSQMEKGESTSEQPKAKSSASSDNSLTQNESENIQNSATGVASSTIMQCLFTSSSNSALDEPLSQEAINTLGNAPTAAVSVETQDTDLVRSSEDSEQREKVFRELGELPKEQSSTDLQSFGNEDGEMRSPGDPESTTSSHDSQFTSNIAEQQGKSNSLEDLSDTSSRDSLLSPSSLTLENAESELSPRRTSLPKRLAFAQPLCTSRKCARKIRDLESANELLRAENTALNNTVGTLGQGQNEIVQALKAVQTEVSRSFLPPERLRLSDLQYHRKIVAHHFAELPVNSVEKVVAVNTALQDLKLAISVVIVTAAEYRLSSSVCSLTRDVILHFLSSETCERFQWKTGKRGDDNRQGFSCLLNLTSVIGAVVNIYSKSRNLEPVEAPKLSDLIKDGRKKGGQAYRSKCGFTEAELNEQKKKAVPVYSPAVKVGGKELLGEIQKKMDALLQAVEDFKIPSG